MKTKPVLIISLLVLVSFLVPSIDCMAKKKVKPEEEADLHYKIGADYYGKGDYLSALRELIQASELDKKNPEIQYLLGATYYQLKKLTEAERHLKTAIELKKNDQGGYPAANNDLGIVYLELGRYDEAIAEFEKCLDYVFYQPKFAQVYTNIGIAYLKKGDSAKAEENFKNAIKQDQTFCPAYLNLADLYGKSGKHDAAVVEYQKVVDYCGAGIIAAKARLYMGVELNELGKKQEACENFFIVLKDAPSTELAVKAGEYIRLLQCK